MTLTVTRLRELVDYDAETGRFFRKWRGCQEWQPIGVKKAHGYIVFQIEGHRDYAHRFAWFYMTGKWPKEIDHTNGDRSDNRWVNIRKASRFLNNGNRRKHRGNLPKGVTKIAGRRGKSLKKPYLARIHINHEQICLGLYKNPDEAHSAYMTAAKKHYGKFARAK